MPAIMIILNIVFIAGVVVGIVGLCAWGIISDRPFATYLTNRAIERQRAQRHAARESAARRRPRRPIDVGA